MQPNHDRDARVRVGKIQISARGGISGVDNEQSSPQLSSASPSVSTQSQSPSLQKESRSRGLGEDRSRGQGEDREHRKGKNEDKKGIKNENKKSSHTRNIYPHLPSRKKQAGYINHKIIFASRKSQIAIRKNL